MITRECCRRVGALIALALLLLGVAAPLSAQTVRYIHTDALGSVVAVTDANRDVIERREYKPYGAQLTPALSDGPGYTGHVQDAATGLTYMQQRYYDPGIGVFLSVDPVTATSSPIESFNRYRYANSNPYKFNDPDGRYVCTASGAQRDAVRSALAELHQSVHSSMSNNHPDRYKVAQIRRFYGSEGVDNGVIVSADSEVVDRAGTAVTQGGGTEIRIHFDNLKNALPNFPTSTYQDLISSTLIHEGNHGVDQRRRSQKGLAAMTTSRTELLASELRAYTSEGLFYRGLGRDSPWLLWTKSGGLNPAYIEHSSNESLEKACKHAGCTP